MKIHPLWFIVIAAALCGCADQQPIVYQEPLTSPGGEFATLPPAVQNSVRAEAGTAEITSISKDNTGGSAIYQFQFRNSDIYPPLYVASDGSVLTSNLNVAVGASEDTIAAATGSETSGIRMDDLPPNVVLTIRHRAPTAEIDSVSRLTSNGDVFYDVIFKDPAHHPKLLIRDDGKLVQ
jgi:Neuraminidase (sialidase)